MAPRKASHAPARKVAARRLKRNSKPRRTPKRSLGSLIVKGVNALMSAIPAANIFSPITDFLFKSVGFTVGVEVPGFYTDKVTYIYGLGAAFAVPLSAIIENTPILVKHRDGNHVSLYTNFTHGQLLNIRITVRPIGELAHRQGNLALAFIPYTTEESGSYYDSHVDIPTLQDVLLVPGAVQGSGTRTLSVNYRARGLQYCNLPHPLTTQIGLVLVGYQDLSRNKGSGFGAEDFGAEVIVSGVVKLSNPLPHVGYDNVSCAVSDKLAGKQMRIGEYTISDGKCEVKEDCILMTGMFSPSPFAHKMKHSLEEHLGPDEPEGSPSSVVSMLKDATLNA